MPFFLLSLVLQVCLVLHVVKTGRNTTWLWIVILLPLAGSIAYLVVEVLPDFLGGRMGRSASRKVGALINPNKDLNEALKNYEISSSTENAIRLAQAYLEKGMHAEAKQLFEKSLTGLHKIDPNFMFGLARAQFGLGEFENCKQTLDELIKLNPDYKNEEAHLLYARTLETLERFEEATHEYETLCKYFTGPEAKYRFALMCKQLGKIEQAQKLLADILFLARTSGNHYNILHKEWIQLAKTESKI